MHTDKDGVFVVEVARGIDSKNLQPGEANSSSLETTDLPFDTKLTANGLHHLDEQSLPPSHEQVQIHAPPQDFAGTGLAPLHLIEEASEEHAQEPELDQGVLARTGLSQSDLSSTSSGDSNKRYSYGNQELYVIEQPGYATSSPTAKPILVTPQEAPPMEKNTGEEVKEVMKPEPEATENQEVPAPKKPAPAEEQPPAEKKEEPEAPEEKKEETPPQSEDQPEPEKDAEIKETEPESKPEVKDPEVEESKPEDAKPEETKPEETQTLAENENEAEANYDSLMSLPAPPSTEEIKELGDYATTALLESSQMDSLPPPPPPAMQEQPEIIVANGNGIGNGKDLDLDAGEPTTLTPPASPPASPPPPSTTGCGVLANGIHAIPTAVDVNGS